MSAPKYTKRSQSQNHSNTRPLRTPLCAYCKNLNQPGLPTDHWLRESPDRESRITCPVLRWEECEYCGIDGHTKKYCDDYKWFLEREKERKEKDRRIIEKDRKERAEYEAKVRANNPSATPEMLLDLFDMIGDAEKDVSIETFERIDAQLDMFDIRSYPQYKELRPYLAREKYPKMSANTKQSSSNTKRASNQNPTNMFDILGDAELEKEDEPDTVRTPEQRGTTCASGSVGVRGFACEAGVSGWRLGTPSGLSGDGLQSKDNAKMTEAEKQNSINKIMNEIETMFANYGAKFVPTDAEIVRRHADVYTPRPTISKDTPTYMKAKQVISPKEDPVIITEKDFPRLSEKSVSSSAKTTPSASVWGTFTKK